MEWLKRFWERLKGISFLKASLIVVAMMIVGFIVVWYGFFAWMAFMH